jgi:hypothetical protein
MKLFLFSRYEPVFLGVALTQPADIVAFWRSL